MAQVPHVFAADARALAADPNVVFVDCRTPEERAVSIIPSRCTLSQGEVDGAGPGAFAGKKLVCYCTVGFRRVVSLLSKVTVVDDWRKENSERSAS